MARKKLTRRENDDGIPKATDDPRLKAWGDVIHFAELYGCTCGIIRADKLYQLFRQARTDSDISEADFVNVLCSASIPNWRCSARIYWEHEGVPYCIDGGLSDGGVYNGMWLDAKHAGFNTEEEYRQRFDDLDNNWEETSKELDEYRINLIRLQGNKPIKVIKNPFSYKDDHEYMLSNPALAKLKDGALTIRRIPKKELMWRAREAEFSILKNSYRISDWGIPDEETLIECAKHLLTFAGFHDYTEAEVDHVASMWARAALHIPLWGLNGHSVSEMGAMDREPDTWAA